jgi:hypothetical protein
MAIFHPEAFIAHSIWYGYRPEYKWAIETDYKLDMITCSCEWNNMFDFDEFLDRFEIKTFGD